jgi:hypothetical protein
MVFWLYVSSSRQLLVTVGYGFPGLALQNNDTQNARFYMIRQSNENKTNNLISEFGAPPRMYEPQALSLLC